ncbi:ATP-binding cassette transporter ABC1 [Emericellopsis cladophorae]|uniref:ATP-binding cassette transporter ABC1 n=1 Tax=Emericellopsis cladophorae TaxID=2686198 RepID=A0A9P9Y4M9_9HYPO|nr:ATP-binding cassette transporter ABC1 [Emericellopsis cladophorae]KAI6783459.1 ATP-binding cassette transporter ABC1 [Emericellopsis cladophorae]
MADPKEDKIQPALEEQIPEHGQHQAESSTPLEKQDSTDERSDDESDDHGAALRTLRSRQMSMGADGRSELVRIATALSHRQSSVAVPTHSRHRLSGVDEYDEALDPGKPGFDLEKWLKRFLNQLREQGMVSRSTGVSFRNLNVYGSGSALRLQSTVASMLMSPLRIPELLRTRRGPKKQILRDFDGKINEGELLVVLGRPGSGCSTFLKMLCGETHGLNLGEQSDINFNGIPQKQMQKEFKGEAIYNQEVDKHFPHLTVGQTLEFAASVRTPSHRIAGLSRQEYSRYIAQVVMAVFNLSHTYNTKVGSDFVRGVSGGERKRVSIAEMTLSAASFAAWDNSTRGLDAATALAFVQSMRTSANLGSHTYAVAIYQASQAIYDLFDKAIVLYEGRQIYFGPAHNARRYFEKQGWYCAPRATTGDFITGVTNPQERQARPGYENIVPNTPDEFERLWRTSPEYKALQRELDQHEQEYMGEERQRETIEQFRRDKNYRQAKHVRPESSYIVSVPMQIKLCTRRAYQRIWGDKAATVSSSIIHLVMALIIGSIFYGTPDATVSFFQKGSVLFMAILLNALTAISEINSLYAQRPIVAKHASYSFYHPACEAAAGIVSDIPVKFVTATVFNVVLYFLANLRREPAQFFLYFLITYMSIFLMSAVFRTMAAATKTVSQAMTGAGILVLALVIYTGFTITQSDMKPWFSWIRWINPIFYAFEILVANEFHGREFPCSSIVPPYPNRAGTDTFVCTVQGAVTGSLTVSGDSFIEANYGYTYAHVWRNFGILIGFLVFFMACYMFVVEINSANENTAEALVFQRGHVPAHLQENGKGASADEESSATANGRVTSGEDSKEAPPEVLPPQRDVFTWRDIVYDIEIKGEPRRLLDHVSGWVKPGTLTALMGVSGAGKTTLLDVLAQRTTMGVVTGDMLVNGTPLDASFQRNTGYVQQQDLHLETSTVRESLRFSAELRQPKSVSREDKYEFVEEVIKMLGMQDFANAVVGVPGEGLNVEQRKLLTIGVELAAKPKLLLFLDEPTSGLDSQSSWAICAFLRRLADSGQAILCTIHQPSAILFQSFDRLLFLAKGGKTVYFGDIGEHSRTLLDYFEASGGRKCSDSENPAEYILEIVNHGTNDQGKDWHQVWNDSEHKRASRAELDAIEAERRGQNRPDANPEEYREFAMPLRAQTWIVTKRIFQQYWRMPSYILAKFLMGMACGLFIGFTFYQTGRTLSMLQNTIFAVFLLTTVFSTLVQQIQPLFVTQRSLYEVRERPSKAYSWKAFMMANIIVEIPYQIFTAILTFACWYYPVLGVQSSQRQVLVLLYVIQLFIYASAFAHMTIAALPDAQTAANIVTLLTLMSITFNGVLQTPTALPGFWIFMYRVSPFTYWIAGIVGTVLHDRRVQCSQRELAVFEAPAGSTCGEYLQPFFSDGAPGYLVDADATTCEYCTVTVADEYIAASRIYWSDRWRNFGIIWAYVVFNVFMAVLLYYVFRVKRVRLGKISMPKTKKMPWVKGA